MIVSSFPTHPGYPEAPMADHIQKLLSALNDSQRYQAELSVQQALNRGVVVSLEDRKALLDVGYLVTHNRDTLNRFKDFELRCQPELEQAIRQAHPDGGLLVDRNKMYRPGPATVKDVKGAAKGYDEIFKEFERSTDEKEKAGEAIGTFIREFYDRFKVSDVPNLLDIGCGNGVQAETLLRHLPPLSWTLYGVDNQEGCIQECKDRFKSHTSCHFLATNVTGQSFHPDLEPLRKKADVVLVSHFYTGQVDALLATIEAYASNNSLLVFVNGMGDTEGDKIANAHTFMRGKPSSNMSWEYEQALTKRGYILSQETFDARLNFPLFTPQLKQFILGLQRGQYEESYANIEPSYRTAKALLEFLASYPLESMTSQEREQYLSSVEACFQINGGPYLKIYNRLIFAVPPQADGLCIKGFRQATSTVPPERSLPRS